MNSRNSLCGLLLSCSFLLGPLAYSAETPQPTSASRLPVRELTVFKDGHAFVVQQGTAQRTTNGTVVLDELPTPVVGTFWTFSPAPHARVTSVTASQQITPVDRTALGLHALIEANPGAEVIITETNQTHYEATLIGFLTRTTAELAATSPPNTPEQLPEQSNIVLLKTGDGTQTLALEQIKTLTFRKAPNLKNVEKEFRNRLSIQLAQDQKPAPTAEIGLMYLQKGVRWIPSYKVDLDGNGHAQVRLQATLINELTDISNATVHLVIGVPSFAFKDTIDPIALQQTAAQLSNFFQGSGGRRSSVFDNNGFSNAIMSQQLQPAFRSSEPEPNAPPVDLPPGTKNEDLYVFTIEHISLRKGQRMVLPISENAITYSDIYTLDIPFAPPSDLSRNFGTQQQIEMARLLGSPKVMHKARLTNKTSQPFTTAPALISRNGQVIAQSMMTYTAAGASSDLPLTTAVDFQVKKSDVEVNRTPNALTHNGDQYFQVALKGQLSIVSHHDKPVQIDVTRSVLGQADSADHDGKVIMANAFEDRDYLPAASPDDMPVWWGYVNWPWWWNQVNGIGRITWQVKLDPGQSVDLEYTWHYYWR